MMTHLPPTPASDETFATAAPPRNGRVAAGRQHGGLFMANLGYTAKKLSISIIYIYVIMNR